MAGQSLSVGAATFTMQSDGNFVAVKNGTVVWSTGQMPSLSLGLMAGKPTYSMPNATYLAVFQSVGNLVLYGPQGAYWANSVAPAESQNQLRFSDLPPYLQILSGSESQLWTAVPSCQAFSGPAASLQAAVDKFICVAMGPGTFEITTLNSGCLRAAPVTMAGPMPANEVMP